MYAVSRLDNSSEPSARAITAANEAATGELVVEALPPHPVWDVTGNLRAKTAEELTAERATAAAARGNEATLRSKLDTALAQAQAIRTSSSSSLSVAQRLDKIEVNQRFFAGVAGWLIRLRLGKLDAAD